MSNPSSDRFPDWLRRRAYTNPDRLALITGDQHLTFAELDARVDLAARWLISIGVEPGDHVAVHLPNSQAFVEIVHAISRCGAITVPVNLRLTPSEISWQLENVRAKFVVTSGTNTEVAARIGADTPGVPIVAIDPHAPDYGSPTAEQAFREYHDSGEIHSIVYTSGTTGRPKGAQISYGNHWWSAIGSALNLGTHADDRWMAVLPLFHVGGLSILMRSVIYGITVVVHETFEPESVNRSIQEDRVTIISVVSTMLRRMIQAQWEVPYPDWLRCVLLGGGPAPQPLLESCADRGIPVTQTYGLTESASQLATLPPDEALLKLGSAGKPLYPCELAIEVDGTLAKPTDPGEIVVRGPNIISGYFDRPVETERAFQDGWFHTGDFGYLDDEGYLYVLDRRDDLIVTGGENVYPAEVEAVLSGHPDIVEAGVIGLQDTEWGQRVVAFVSVQAGTDPGPDPEDLSTWCRTNLAGYKIPTEFQFTVDPLPRNAGGKLMRRLLREQWRS